MWAPQMKHTDVDKKWWKAVRYYSTNQDDKIRRPDDTNAGQKFCSGGFSGALWRCLRVASFYGSRSASHGIFAP